MPLRPGVDNLSPSGPNRDRLDDLLVSLDRIRRTGLR